MGNQVRLEVVGVVLRVVHILVDLHRHHHRRVAHEHAAAAHHTEVARSLVNLRRHRIRAHGTGREVLADHLFTVDVGDDTLASVEAQFKSGVAARHRGNRDRQRVVAGVGVHVRERSGDVLLPGGIHVVAPVRGALDLRGVLPSVQHRDDVVRVEGNLLSGLVLQAAAEQLNSVHDDVEVGARRPAGRRPTHHPPQTERTHR